MSSFSNNNKTLSFSEKNSNRVQKLLDRDPGNIRAVIANTIETKKISGKLAILDRIFNSVRQQMGFKISFKDAESLLKQFVAIDQAMDKIIEEATEKEIIRPRQEIIKFSNVKDEIIALLKKGSTEKEIAEKYKITLEKAKGWLFTIYGEMPELKPVEKTAKKTAKKD